MSIRSSAVLLISILTVFLFVQTKYTTLIIEGKNGVDALLLKNGEIVELSFVHSVELSRWVEVYEIHPNRLILIEAKTKSFGWGLPYNGNFSFEDGWMVFRMHRTFRELRISTSDINDYTLIVGGKILKLDSFGDLVTIRPKGGLIQWIKIKACNCLKQNKV